MVLHSLKSRIQFAKAIASANLRTLEAISILAETDALKYDKRSGYSNAVQWY